MPAIKICKVDGCDKNSYLRGWCNAHYIRWQRHGNPLAGKSYKVPGRLCSVSGCEGKHHANGFCARHNNKNQKYGDATYEAPVAKKVWIYENFTHDGDECLIWPFHKGEAGRGCGGNFGGRRITAARAMCIAAHGEPPTPQHHAAHSCGKGHIGCVNPKHLRWATPYENTMEKVDHGTMRRGSSVNTSRLTADQVREIRLMNLTSGYAAIGAKFGVTAGSIVSIVRRKSWAWLED